MEAIENEKSFQTRLKYIFKRKLTWTRDASRESSVTENIYDADRPGKIPEGCWPNKCGLPTHFNEWTRVDFGANLLRFHLVVAAGLCIMIVAQL